MMFWLKVHICNIALRWARRWMREVEAVAAVEAALVFPVLLTLLLGVFDMGNALLANQKAIRSSQIVADLITRARTASNSDINEAINAGGLAFAPLDAASYGIDIVSLAYDDDGNPGIAFRETRNMSPNANVFDDAASLAHANGGVVVVTVEYIFSPVFAGFIIDEIKMQEKAFARGRKSAVVRPE